MKKLLYVTVPIVGLLMFGFSYMSYENYNDLKADLLNEVVSLTEQVEPKTQYTDDQIKVIEEFGKPDEFIINFEFNNEPRYEIWKYVGLGEIFIFEGGKYVQGASHDFNIPDNEPYLRAKISPKDVYDLKNIEDLNNLIAVKPTSKGSIDNTNLQNTQYYDYGDVISAATSNNSLVYVKTQTFVVSE